MTDWDSAACFGRARIMFPYEAHDRMVQAFQYPGDAKKVCGECPIKDACLQRCLKLDQKHGLQSGVWGGKDETERKALMEGRSGPRLREFCPRKHSMSGTNVLIMADGGRRCVQCLREKRRRADLRRQQLTLEFST